MGQNQWHKVYVFVIGFTSSLLLGMRSEESVTGYMVSVSFLIGLLSAAIFELLVYFFADFFYDALVKAADRMRDQQIAQLFEKANQRAEEEISLGSVRIDDGFLQVNGKMVRLSEEEHDTIFRLISAVQRGQHRDAAPVADIPPSMVTKLIRVGLIDAQGFWTAPARAFFNA